MGTLNQGRWTHDHGDESVVVFLIGMRVNRLRAIRTWLPVARAMPRMLAELAKDPALGLLGVTSCIQGRGALSVQYWRDAESLLAYAHDPDHEHRPAWREFNRLVRDADGVVGIWHETFVVPARAHESVYVDMPSQGLLGALGALRVDSRLNSARERLRRAA
jgi:Domain of unknown function (DUF4188)